MFQRGSPHRWTSPWSDSPDPTTYRRTSDVRPPPAEPDQRPPTVQPQRLPGAVGVPAAVDRERGAVDEPAARSGSARNATALGHVVRRGEPRHRHVVGDVGVPVSARRPATRRPSAVFTQPGQTALTRTPRPPHSTARVRVMPIRPCLLALYAARSATPSSPATEAMLTIEPGAADQHPPPERLAEQERPGQVHVDDPPPLRRGGLLGRRDPGDAGVVDQDVARRRTRRRPRCANRPRRPRRRRRPRPAGRVPGRTGFRVDDTPAGTPPRPAPRRCAAPMPCAAPVTTATRVSVICRP